jgi:hypothetical protein
MPEILAAGGTGTGTGTGGDDAIDLAGFGESNSASSEIAWGFISILILWGLGLVLLGIVFAIACQDKKKRLVLATNTAQQDPADDVEASKSNNNHEQQQQTPTKTRLSLIVSVFAAVTAFSASIVPHASCNYFDVYSDNYDTEFSSLGLWKVKYAPGREEDKCYSNFRTADFQVDMALTVARAAAILATTIGGISMLVLLYYTLVASSSTKLSGGLGRYLALTLLVAAFFQGLTLIIHASDQCQVSTTSCEVDNGALSAITSTFYWFLCAVAVL